MLLALTGNPNCGKTALFNALTGSNGHVGNFPGITVDQKVALIKNTDNCFLTDLPGIYSLRPYSSEEIITRDFILTQKPDGIINIADATNIERNLYLTLRLTELRIPMILVLNMMDEVKNNKGHINIPLLSKELGIPVIPASAVKNEGIKEITECIVNTVKEKKLPPDLTVKFNSPIKKCIYSVSYLIEKHALHIGLPVIFCANEFIEGNMILKKRLRLSKNELKLIENTVTDTEREFGVDRNIEAARMRYEFIEKLCEKTLKKPNESKEYNLSKKTDKILTNKYLALPIFFLIMFLIFHLTFNILGGPLSDSLAYIIKDLTEFTNNIFTEYKIHPAIRSLVIDGIFSGVGSVLSFLPLIVTLFFFLSLLEDTGYMARIAFITDKLLCKIGLSGKSLVPLLIGFGCSVPAVMATRTLPSERDKKLTLFLIPYISCSAKIPIYALFCRTFFGNYSAVVILLIYIIGMVIGIIIALFMKNTVFFGKSDSFITELPNYRLPSLKSTLLLLWDKAKDFIQKAFSIIFISSIIIWFLMNFGSDFKPITSDTKSLLTYLSIFLLPVFTPLGLGDPKIIAALISGFTAKENVISTLGVLPGSGNLSSELHTLFSPLTAFVFLIFTSLYTPCIATVAVAKHESKSVFKAVGIVILQCLVAWLAAFLLYKVGGLIM